MLAWNYFILHKSMMRQAIQFNVLGFEMSLKQNLTDVFFD